MENKYTLEFNEEELVSLKLALYFYKPDNNDVLDKNRLNTAALWQRLEKMDKRSRKS